MAGGGGVRLRPGGREGMGKGGGSFSERQTKDIFNFAFPYL